MPASAAPPRADAKARGVWIALIHRLHFYIGLLVAPFILTAALSGALYALTPSLEAWLYADALRAPASGAPQPLSAQVEAARASIDGHPAPAAIRPAPLPGTTTRVMFAEPKLGGSMHLAVFVDPVSLELRGTLPVYGTSGLLPLRTWIDHFHRSLHLGEFGRAYSELAASWLWLLALGGTALWWLGRGGQRRGTARHHATLGLILLVGLAFFSATGLTWSKWAGERISELRSALDWGTPSVSTQLDPARIEPRHDPQAAHHGAMDEPATAAFDPAQADLVLAAARGAGLGAPRIELRPSNDQARAWTVREIDYQWPTQADSAAIDPRDGRVVDLLRFADFPLAAKLTRWGVDAHIGMLFGLPNQLLLAATALGLALLIIWGYRLWWRRRPRRLEPLWYALARLPRRAWPALALATALLGWALPVLGASLALLLAIDGLRLALRRAGPRRQIG
ncbi:PepSY-associated TM helix domain-containing protein [Halotalea alkalilenta]|uniref:PepSY-associated TM helix domain-containing protein n=1 Tax=Halotalea alkalilenta TaxID=376489 RepID=UPI0006948AE7|nr:PepSY-associated TM helix domain-containing protein [Halotalea alkalilenta]